MESKSAGLNNSQISRRLKISRPSVIGLLKGQKIPPPKEKPKTVIITLHLKIENNNKFVRGKKRVRENIEIYHLSRYRMRKLQGWEHDIMFSYKSDEDLQKQIDDLYREMDNEVDFRNCFIEADFYDKINDRSF